MSTENITSLIKAVRTMLGYETIHPDHPLPFKTLLTDIQSRGQGLIMKAPAIKRKFGALANLMVVNSGLPSASAKSLEAKSKLLSLIMLTMGGVKYDAFLSVLLAEQGIDSIAGLFLLSDKAFGDLVIGLLYDSYPELESFITYTRSLVLK
jgi:hypothetical protein